jgi:ubiquitin C-terminal hydrolase
MNSTLQCLSNTPGLTDYFLEKKHIPQINRENPLGWGGKVADAYGILLIILNPSARTDIASLGCAVYEQVIC